MTSAVHRLPRETEVCFEGRRAEAWMGFDVLELLELGPFRRGIEAGGVLRERRFQLVARGRGPGPCWHDDIVEVLVHPGSVVGGPGCG